MSKWTDPRYDKFAADMEAAGLDVEEYHGRWGYDGPAVWTDGAEGISLQDALSATKVRVIWDTCGRDWIVYPDSAERIQQFKETMFFMDDIQRMRTSE